MNEADGVGEVAAIGLLHALDFDVAPIVGGHRVAAQLAARLAYEGAFLVLEGVEIEVEAEFTDAIGRLVAPSQGFLAGDRFGGGVEPRGNGIADDLVGHRGDGRRPRETSEERDGRKEAFHNAMTTHDGSAVRAFARLAFPRCGTAHSTRLWCRSELAFLWTWRAPCARQDQHVDKKCARTAVDTSLVIATL